MPAVCVAAEAAPQQAVTKNIARKIETEFLLIA
jgi:hypothetical protein